MPFGQVESFNVQNNNWDAYIRRLKQFITLNNISDNLKVATLVTVVGAECYDLMCDLCSPDAPESKTFDALVTLVKEHLEPNRSEIAERHIFRQRTQRQGESIRDYLQALKHLAKTCNFGSCLETNLRDQFVSGLFDEDMRSRIFTERSIDYKRAVELALALEAAERHAATACATGVPGAAGRLAASRDDGLHRFGAGAGERASVGSRSGASAGAAARRECGRCGKAGHTDGKCRYKQYTCDVCGQKGHLKVMCKTKGEGRERSVKKPTRGQFFLNNSDTDDDDDHFYNLVVNSDGDGPYYASVNIENVTCKFEIDTGSKISAISKRFYDKHFPHLPIIDKLLTLRSYTGDVIETVGYIVVNVIYATKQAKLNLYVIEKGGPPLMGRTWIKQLQLSIVQCHSLTEENSMAESLKKEYPDVFADGLGTFKSEFRLYLKDNTPVFVKARPLPLALREPVERELERLQREGVVRKVERSDYGTPIVPVVKANGGIRLCGDYKITINPLLKDFHYPLPRIEDLFATLGGGEQYTKLDLSNAFQQCRLEKDSQPMTAITTHVGTFVYERVPFGIKCIPENFQKIMEETLSGLPSTAVFADDICVTGKDRVTHLANLRAVLQRLKENGLRINYSKCEFFKESVTYLGYKIDKSGLHTDKRKIEAIVAAPTPINVTQLKSFMGLVNFYAKFCSNMSDILKPLYNLLKKSVQWQWSDDCERAFNKIKQVLSSSPVLAHYDASLPLILSVDSSAYGLGAALTQRYADGSERAVCCASRTLVPAEVNYSQLDKEALAIVFGVTRHHQYLYGRRFILRSDHKPLSYIFGNNKGIPVTAASRLQRYAIKLAAYDFEIEFVRSEQNSFADALSRLPLESTEGRSRREGEECSYLNYAQDSFPVNFKDIKIETAKDPLLSKIFGYVMYGWPSKLNNDIENAYYSRKESLHLEQGCLVWGYRIVVPRSLRENVLKEIHDGHPGIVKMKQIARNYVWWENLDGDIERVVRECPACRAQRPAPPPVAPLHSWPWPEEAWSRLHLDFLGPFNNYHYLVIIDAHSKWIEVERLKKTTATIIIDRLRRIFARFGLPKRIVSDNGPPFSSAEFGHYLERNGIKQTLIAPYHPASNGAAENAVRTIKRVLKKAQMENEDSGTALSRFLFTYRNTEQGTTKREPAVALLGRRLRGRLDLLRPDVGAAPRSVQLDREQRQPPAVNLRVAQVGDAILMRDYSKNNAKWAEGVVVQRSGPVSYSVQTKDGHVHKRHIDQLLVESNRKSRYSLSNVHDDLPNDRATYSQNPIALPPESNTEDKDEFYDVEDEPTAPPVTPLPASPPPLPLVQTPTQDNNARPRRRAAARCIEKLKNKTN